MSTLTVTHATPEEYLAAERLSETRSEYLDGGVCPRTGASLNHGRIALNVATELSLQLRERECDVLIADMKVGLQESRKFFYPDVCVLCGEPQFHDERTDIILNPDSSSKSSPLARRLSTGARSSRLTGRSSL
jgi:Uma2 family endonuclease